jgi:hypothetical protein
MSPEATGNTHGLTLADAGLASVIAPRVDRNTETPAVGPSVAARRMTGLDDCPAGGDLTIEHRGQVLLVSPAGVAGVVGQP